MPAALTLRLAGWALLLGLCACAQQRAEHAAESAAKAFEARGYEAVDALAVVSTQDRWTLAGNEVPVRLMLPARAGRWPVVLYLPGLGEDAAAGARWRARWAAAGYAVLSVQPLEADATAFRSELARSGEFKALGRERFAAAALARRLQALDELIGEGRRRAAAPSSGAWQSLDWDRLAVAGFDLGAYTAMAMAGEHVPGLPKELERSRARAVLAFSPHASLAGGALDTRWGDVRIPVLSITSDADGDPLGLVETAALRDAPFAHMPGPDKLLLRLSALPHAELSGSESAAEAKPDAAAEGPRPRTTDSDNRDSSRHRGGRRSDSASPTTAAAPGAPTAGSARLRVVAAQDVSLAFLDAHLKDDPLARRWLAEDASRWLGAVGMLQVR